jgi:hypothetical protein
LIFLINDHTIVAIKENKQPHPTLPKGEGFASQEAICASLPFGEGWGGAYLKTNDYN